MTSFLKGAQTDILADNANDGSYIYITWMTTKGFAQRNFRKMSNSSTSASICKLETIYGVQGSIPSPIASQYMLTISLLILNFFIFSPLKSRSSLVRFFSCMFTKPQKKLNKTLMSLHLPTLLGPDQAASALLTALNLNFPSPPYAEML